MGIPFTCPHCGHYTNVQDRFAGETGPCAGCGKEVTVPAVITPWNCPQCSNRMPAGTDSCSNCGLAFRQPLRPNVGTYDIAEDALTRAIVPVGRSGYALVAGYLGLLSFIPLLGLLAIIFGVLAIRDLQRRPERRGMGRAIFGIVVGSVSSLVFVAVLIGLVVGRF